MTRFKMLRPKRIEYPVGSTWETDQDNWHYKVFLQRILGWLHDQRQEVWWATVTRDNETVYDEWFETKAQATKAAKNYMNSPEPRFKRTK